MADRSLLRWPRAAMFAAVCVALAAAGHGLMSGRPAPLWALAVGLVAVLAVAVPLAGRERSLGVIVTSVLAAQLGLHVLFTFAGRTPGGGLAALPTGWQALLLCAPGVAAGSGGAGLDLTRSLGLGPAAGSAALLQQIASHSADAPGGHGLALGHQLSVASAMPAMSSMGWPIGHAGLGMLLAHVCAALIAAWWLRRGEAAVHSLARWARGRALCPWRRLCALIAGPRPLVGVRPRVGRPGRIWRSTGAALRHVPRRRGPPPYARYC